MFWLDRNRLSGVPHALERRQPAELGLAEGSAHAAAVGVADEIERHVAGGPGRQRALGVLHPGDVVGVVAALPTAVAVHLPRGGATTERRGIVRHGGDRVATGLQDDVRERRGRAVRARDDRVDRTVIECVQVVGAPVVAAPGRVARIDERLQRAIRHRLHPIGSRRHDAAQITEQRLAACVVSEPRHDDADGGLQAQRLRHERCGRREEEGDAAAPLRRRIAQQIAIRAAHGRGIGAREQEHAAQHHRPDRVQRELEFGDDAEVAAAALESPEQLGVLVRTGGDQPAVGRDQLGRQQVVASQPVQPLEPAAAAAEDEAGDARAGNAPAGGGQTEGLRLAIELAPREAGLRAHAPPGSVHAHALHGRQVQQEPAFDGGVAGHRVPAPAHRKRHAVLAREVDGSHHVGRAGGARDHRGPPIEHGVECGPAGVEPCAIGRREQLSVKARTQGCEIDHARQGRRHRRRAQCRASHQATTRSNRASATTARSPWRCSPIPTAAARTPGIRCRSAPAPDHRPSRPTAADGPVEAVTRAV